MDPAARRLLERDDAAFLTQALSTPCLDVIDSCGGSELRTVSGRVLLDFHGNSVHQVGYGHPRVIEAIRRQLDTMPFCPRRYTNEPAVRLAERLGEISPGGRLNKVLLTPGGAEAMSMAMKLARIATGKNGFVSFWGSFHGATLDTISIGGERHFREGAGALLPGCEHVFPPLARDCRYGCAGRCNFGCASAIRDVLERNPDIAAVIAEPIRCTTVDPAPSGFWARVRETCDAYGVLLIFDEIPIGLGRTGRMFACQRDEVTPDILVLGKGLGGGVLPLAAMLVRPELNVAGRTSLGHFTHEKNPVLCAAALATIDVIQEEGLVERSRVLGESFLTRLDRFKSLFSCVGQIRGLGLLIGVQIEACEGHPDPSRTAERIMFECLGRGLSFKVSSGNVLTLTPPLTVSDEEIDRALQILEASFAAVCSSPTQA
jgi:4-aminobutyrate aminotransferase